MRGRAQWLLQHLASAGPYTCPHTCPAPPTASTRGTARKALGCPLGSGPSCPSPWMLLAVPSWEWGQQLSAAPGQNRGSGAQGLGSEEGRTLAAGGGTGSSAQGQWANTHPAGAAPMAAAGPLLCFLNLPRGPLPKSAPRLALLAQPKWSDTSPGTLPPSPGQWRRWVGLAVWMWGPGLPTPQTHRSYPRPG